jgi:plastocyanin
MGTVAIIPGKGGAQFNPPGIKLPAGNTVTWVNKTGQAQTLITDSNSKNITLTPGQPMSMSFPEAGRMYTWHLASNPQASITVYVGGR